MRFTERPLSLRRRVLLALVGIVAVFVAVQGALAYLSLADQEDDLADDWVLAEARRLAAQAQRGEIEGPRAAEVLRPTPTRSAWLVDSAGHALPQPLPDHLVGLADGTHRPKSAGAELHVVVLTIPQGRLYVQYDAKSNEDKVDQFGVYLLGLGILCVALALAASHWIAAVVLAPIERLTSQLTHWVPGASIAQASSDEEAQLFDAFRRVQDRFEKAVAREREFVSNVGHEIRTPLTALRTDLELLGLSEDDPAKQQRLQRAISMVDALNASIESARVLSQRQSVQVERIDLARCVDDARSSLSGHPGMARLRFVNAVPPATFVSVDPHSLLTILRNLIRNSAEHAAPAECVVSFADQCIAVSDDGPGIAREDLAFIFDRYYRGRLKDSPGVEPGDHGLGLAIARQIADQNGWSLTAEASAGRGVRFLLRLA